MRIAQVAPIWIKIPPEKYGGAEQIISFLTEGLVKKGHNVTLFASGDSQTKAKLFSVRKESPGLGKQAINNLSYNMKNLFNSFSVIDKESEFDLIHWHFSKDYTPLMFAKIVKKPSIITIHNQFDINDPDQKDIFNHYRDLKYFVSISNSHQKLFPFSFIDTVYNGIDLNQFELNIKPEKYLVWLGRFSGYKGAHVAIQVALKLGLPLKLAAPLSEGNYFQQEIKPFLNKNNIEYIGEIDSIARNELLKNALVFLNPISWEEPFGLVVLEANACGTPVVSYNRGAMPELIKDNLNGLLVSPDDFEGFVDSVKRIVDMPEEQYQQMRLSCRHHVEENFTIEKMVNGYEKVYQKVIGDLEVENGAKG